MDMGKNEHEARHHYHMQRIHSTELNTDKYDDFTDKLIDNVTGAQTFSPTAFIILGDFNTGNILLDRDIYARSATTSFDLK